MLLITRFGVVSHDVGFTSGNGVAKAIAEEDLRRIRKHDREISGRRYSARPHGADVDLRGDGALPFVALDLEGDVPRAGAAIRARRS